MFDRAREELEYEFNARYDYIKEAYGDLGDDPATLRLEARLEWEEEMIESQDAMEARGGPVFRPALDDLPF